MSQLITGLRLQNSLLICSANISPCWEQCAKTSQKFRLRFMPVRGDLWDQACSVFAKSNPWCPMCQKITRPLCFYPVCMTKKEVDEVSGKPVMILDYNKMKGAVDRVDQLCHNYSVQRRTTRWPLAYFYNCLNLAAINAQVVFIAKFPGWEAGSPHRRCIFLENLGL